MKQARKIEFEQNVLFEQLALKRLKRKRLHRRRLWTLLARFLAAFRTVEIERETAPGQPAQKRHEWERIDLRIVR
jgi:hypothetical protein